MSHAKPSSIGIVWNRSEINVLNIISHFLLLLNGDGGEEEGGGDAAVDVAVLAVGFLLVGGEGGDVGGVGGFDDGVEVEG